MPTDGYDYQFDSAACAWKNIGPKNPNSLSISEARIEAAFYPNPFSDKIELSLPADGTMTSIEGKAVMAFEREKTLDTRSIEPGTYFLSIGKKTYTLIKY